MPSLRKPDLTFALALGVLAALGGCTSSAPPDSGLVEVRTADERQLAEEVAKHRGKVVLVDYWATWCTSCKELFPHNVALYRRLARKGLVVISVAADEPSDLADVLEFLKSQQATFPNFTSLYGSSAQTMERFQIPEGVVPHLKLYSRRGTLSTTFGVGGERLEPEAIDRAVERLLKES